ncbi:AMIN-like domain-containing (lipo)protein [Xylanimonas protaetiae]|uniref:AMIN-like domain-containing protein n=1 Tax=Xylanimonas protaetiae TaxID=2509457 RepID=A0A4P6F2G1_9MICO|nr:hypothetical protein [Xylanimonas protaetiae]QAY69406.1 hypothetical protein ET471_04595 [Xylanimonas protaetiae]
MRTRLRITAAASLALALLLGACGASRAEHPEAGVAVADDVRAEAAAGEADTAVVHDDAAPDDIWWWLDAPPSHDASAVVTGVRAGLHDGFDRIVVDLAGQGVPGWGTELVETATDEGSGYPVDVTGDQFVLLRLAGMAFPPDADPAHVDPFVLDVGGESVSQVAVRFWHEGNLNVFLGLVGDAEPSVTVTLQEDPLALVVDVARPVV